jgi:YesN/AraC family two-component response regulator
MDILNFPILTNEDKKLPFYIKSIGMHYNQDHILRTKGTDDYHYIQSCKGTGKLIIGGKKYLIKENTAFIFDPYIMHEYYAIEYPWTTKWLTFSGFAASEFSKLIYNEFKVFDLNNKNILEKHLDEIQEILKHHSKTNNSVCSGKLYKFLLDLKDLISCENEYLGVPNENKLKPVLDYLESNFSKDLTLDEMANLIEITPQHLCRLFKKTFSMRPFEYLTHVRIRRAKEILTLKTRNYTVKEITNMIGYNDTSYFCAQFKEVEGCTPLEFKNMI